MEAYIKKAASSNWGTPESILKEYRDFFDPCPFPLPEWNGLKVEWEKRNFVNPPFGKLKEWTRKCRDEYMKGKEIVLLMPARVDTRYFHAYVLPYAEITFIKGRLKFVDLDNSSKEVVSAPFPTILAHYHHRKAPAAHTYN